MGKTFRFGGFGERKTRKESTLRAYDAKPNREELIDTMAYMRKVQNSRQDWRDYMIDDMVDNNTTEGE